MAWLWKATASLFCVQISGNYWGMACFDGLMR